MRDVGYKTEVIAVLAILAFFRCTSGVLAQEQTTQQLPLPTGKTQTQSEDKRWQLTFDSNWSYFSTTQTSPTVPGWAKSTLNYLPVAMQFVGITDDLKLEVLVRSGYMDLYQASSGGGARRIDGWTDTSVNTTVTYYG